MLRVSDVHVITPLVLKLPRTPTDFAMLNCWVWAGYSDEKIFKRMKKEWRSEVITLDGKPHCARCLQRINPISCIECGQPEERST